MCVIALITEKRPSENLVRAAWNHNSDGGGIAWRDKVQNEEGEIKAIVRWKKGLDLAEMQEMIKELPFPFVAHFRKRSIGDSSDELCHPFPISPWAELDLEGETEGAVLFHNGTWRDWDKYLFQFVSFRPGMKLPAGAYSDTRAMAILASATGVGLMDFLGAKGVAFGPDHMDIFEGTSTTTDGNGVIVGGWKKVEGIWVSNDKFDKEVTKVTTPHYPTQSPYQSGKNDQEQVTQARSSLPIKNQSRIYCRNPQCIIKQGLDEEGLCPTHSKKNQSQVKPLALPPSSLKKNGNNTGKDDTTTTEPSIIDLATLPKARPVRQHRRGTKISPYQETVDLLREVAETRGPLEAGVLATAALNANPQRLSKSQWKRLMGEFQQLQHSQRKKREKELVETFTGKQGPRVH